MRMIQNRRRNSATSVCKSSCESSIVPSGKPASNILSAYISYSLCPRRRRRLGSVQHVCFNFEKSDHCFVCFHSKYRKGGLTLIIIDLIKVPTEKKHMQVNI